MVFVERASPPVVKPAGCLITLCPVIRDQITTGNMQSARSLAKIPTDRVIARMIEKGIQRIGKPIENIEKSIKMWQAGTITGWKKNLVILSIIAGIALCSAFLGTTVQDDPNLFQYLHHL